MRGDPQIVVSDDATAGFQFGTKGTIAATRIRRQGQDGQETGKFFKLPHRSLALLALFGSIDQFAVGNDRNRRFSNLQALETLLDLRRTAPPDVDADVGIKEKCRVHLQRFARLWRGVIPAVAEKIVR